MGFHENLIQSFRNFRNVFLGNTDISDIGDGTITDAINTLNEGKQNVLTFDNSPTSGSNNPVTSGGIFTALQNVDIDVDSALSSISENPVQNKVVTGALGLKQDSLTAGAGITITNNIISATTGLSVEIVQELPSTDISSDKLYLVPNSSSSADNIYDEYIYVNNAWENIGSTAIDLEDYYTKTQVDTALNLKQDTLTAGSGIIIDEDNVIKTMGATIYANALFPSGE